MKKAGYFGTPEEAFRCSKTFCPGAHPPGGKLYRQVPAVLGMY
jgi:hypothetical protein